jgi:hypothetical protein
LYGPQTETRSPCRNTSSISLKRDFRTTAIAENSEIQIIPEDGTYTGVLQILKLEAVVQIAPPEEKE